MAPIEASKEVGASVPTTPPPRENLIRAIQPGLELREATDAATGPVMAGHFAVFNEFTEIDSWYEGRFLERIAPGAFKKTFAENRDNIKVTLNHGFDPSLGDKPLGAIDVLEEDSTGARYEVPLLDARYVTEDVLPGLRAGLYGASFRFRVMQEEFNNKPKTSAANPDGLPERTIKEVQVMEFGPVTFPAYVGATAGVRSLTDEFIARSMVGRFRDDPARARAMFEQFFPGRDNSEPEPSGATTQATSEPEPSGATTPVKGGAFVPLYPSNRKEKPSWLL